MGTVSLEDGQHAIQYLQMICEFPNIPHRLLVSWKEAGLRLVAGLASSLGWAGIESQVQPSCFSAQPKHQEGGFHWQHWSAVTSLFSLSILLEVGPITS